MPIELAKKALDVGIVTRDGERLYRFYREVFGLEPIEDLMMPGIGKVLRLKLGESVLRIYVPETPPEGDAAEGGLDGRPGYRYQTFEVVDFDAAIEAIEAGGGRVVFGPVEPRPGRRVAQIVDPDGNQIEIGYTAA